MKCRRVMSLATSLFPYVRNCCLFSALPHGFGETASVAFFRRSTRFDLLPRVNVVAFTGSASCVGGKTPVRNRYERLRSCLPVVSSAVNSRTRANDIAKKAVVALTRKSRTWKRLGPVVDLACGGSDRENIKSVADVGTDHGILAIALATTGQYEKVFGVDVSEVALRQGARVFHRKILGVLLRGSVMPPGGNAGNFLPLEFRVGNGLCPLEPGDADAVVICGMGVSNMRNILSPKELDRLGTKRLYLQPTNSRPRNLIALYDSLQHNGWRLQEERIQRISNRWYISSSFQKDPLQLGCGNLTLPGDKLQLSDITTDSMRQEHQQYVEHHLTWLERDLQTRGYLDEAEQRWRKKYSM